MGLRAGLGITSKRHRGQARPPLIESTIGAYKEVMIQVVVQYEIVSEITLPRGRVNRPFLLNYDLASDNMVCYRY